MATARDNRRRRERNRRRNLAGRIAAIAKTLPLKGARPYYEPCKIRLEFFRGRVKRVVYRERRTEAFRDMMEQLRVMCAGVTVDLSALRREIKEKAEGATP